MIINEMQLLVVFPIREILQLAGCINRIKCK